MSSDPASLLPFRKKIKYKKDHKALEGSPFENKWDFVGKKVPRIKKPRVKFVSRS